MKQNNYEQMRNQMRDHFLDFDQMEMIRKFGLSYSDEYLYIRFFGREYRIDRRSGVVVWSMDGFETCTEGDYNESMTIYDVLCCSHPNCMLSGRFAPSGSLKGTVYTGNNAGGGSMFAGAAKAFDGNMEALALACERMGGTLNGRGDVSYLLPMFDFLPVQFSFWEGDDEFPPEINLLWDTNVLDFMHYETLWFAAGHLVKLLQAYIKESVRG